MTAAQKLWPCPHLPASGSNEWVQLGADIDGEAERDHGGLGDSVSLSSMEILLLLVLIKMMPQK